MNWVCAIVVFVCVHVPLCPIGHLPRVYMYCCVLVTLASCVYMYMYMHMHRSDLVALALMCTCPNGTCLVFAINLAIAVPFTGYSRVS